MVETESLWRSLWRPIVSQLLKKFARSSCFLNPLLIATDFLPWNRLSGFTKGGPMKADKAWSIKRYTYEHIDRGVLERGYPRLP